MRDTTVFLKLKRRSASYRPVAERLKDYEEVSPLREEAASAEQASRCVACAVPFCHWRCPIGNYIPDWNDFLATGQWREAYRALSATNDLPEITGRVCPAFCENGCILEPDGQAVTIRENELAVIEHAFEAGLVVPEPPASRSDKTVAVVGSGPAGLSCAVQLNRAGHRVTVFERDDKLGGILRYGIPDFKLEKWLIDRRVEIWKKEGIEFLTGVEVGADFPVEKLLKAFDAVCLAGGSRLPRDLKVEGRELRGIHFAMDFLTQSNRRVAGETIAPERLIDAKGKRVVVMGGGDTGADCVGTSHRQGARQVVQVELLPKPPASRQAGDRWPRDPYVLKTSSSHEEGGIREWAVMTKRFLGDNGVVKKLACVRAECLQPDKKLPPKFRRSPEPILRSRPIWCSWRWAFFLRSRPACLPRWA
jgi:glutamate synthase (NADPH/NADH) small chain